MPGVNMIPAVLTGFMVLTSAFNNDLKVFVWLMTLIPFLVGLVYLQKDCLFKPNIMSPMISAFFIMFTLGYMVCPMAMHRDWNYVAITVFLALFIADVKLSQTSECFDNRWSSVKGAVVGFIVGIGMYLFALSLGLAKYLYYSSPQGGMYCARPKEQNFKCHVYKNGEIISAL